MTISDKLNESAQKYRQALLELPSTGIEEALKYMTPRPGVTYKETVGHLTGTMQLRPYDGNKNAGNNVGLGERTLETFLGSCVEEFDPNGLYRTLWAQLQGHSGRVENPNMNKAILFKIMDSVLANLNSSLFSAVRNGSGTTTADLFNGFDTITAADIAAETPKISAALGNYAAVEAITNSNAVDILKAFYRKASSELKGIQTKMFVPYEVWEFYCDDYLTTLGAAPYNNQFEQTFLIGSNKRCEIVPLVSKASSKFIHLTTKENLLYGYGAGVEQEQIEVRRGDNPFLSQFVLTMFFGVEFETADKKRLLVGEIAGGSSN
jgi:hypothetical protein